MFYRASIIMHGQLSGCRQFSPPTSKKLHEPRSGILQNFVLLISRSYEAIMSNDLTLLILYQVPINLGAIVGTRTSSNWAWTSSPIPAAQSPDLSVTGFDPVTDHVNTGKYFRGKWESWNNPMSPLIRIDMYILNPRSGAKDKLCSL